MLSSGGTMKWTRSMRQCFARCSTTCRHTPELRRRRLLLLARSLERVADHATNFGEEVHYLVEGHDIRHQE
jgi:phosphate uptake regulator